MLPDFDTQSVKDLVVVDGHVADERASDFVDGRFAAVVVSAALETLAAILVKLGAPRLRHWRLEVSEQVAFVLEKRTHFFAADLAMDRTARSGGASSRPGANLKTFFTITDRGRK